jgi:DnaD/phage-associated family protein
VDRGGGGEIDVRDTPLAEGHIPLRAARSPLPRIRVIAERPSIYTLYEQNIGLLTPLVAEQMLEAERRYPRDWIEEAFGEAVGNNKLSWRYIERILERWALEGKKSGKDRGPDERALDPDKYTKGKYAFLFAGPGADDGRRARERRA